MKYFSFFLIAAGLLLVFYSVFASVQIFVYEKEPPQLFESTEIHLEMEEESLPLHELLFLDELMNAIAWSVFAALLIFAGSVVATLGVKIMRAQDT